MVIAGDDIVGRATCFLCYEELAEFAQANPRSFRIAGLLSLRVQVIYRNLAFVDVIKLEYLHLRVFRSDIAVLLRLRQLHQERFYGYLCAYLTQ